MRRSLACLLVIGLLTACGSAAQPAQLVGSPAVQPDTSVPAATAKPSTTSRPKATVKPNATPKATARPKATPRPTPRPAAVHYQNCAAVRAAGKAPLHRGDPGYRAGLDRDNDGLACE